MLWNWTTLNACFLSKDWKITSTAKFVGSCIGIVFLVMALELLRRLSSEYDAFLVRRYAAKLGARSASDAARLSTSGDAVDCYRASSTHREGNALSDENGIEKGVVIDASRRPGTFLPSCWEQGLRAFLHVCQFAVAYITMLLAM
jgi:solute carrier family 31 (copper transporter), member 1